MIVFKAISYTSSLVFLLSDCVLSILYCFNFSIDGLSLNLTLELLLVLLFSSVNVSFFIFSTATAVSVFVIFLFETVISSSSSNIHMIGYNKEKQENIKPM